MATRILPTAINARLDDDVVEIYLAVHLDLITSSGSSEQLRIWSGVGTLSESGQTWLGVGNLLSIDMVKEGFLTPQGAKISLSGISSEYLGKALTYPYQNRPGTIYLGFLDPDDGSSVGIMEIFKGKIDQMVIVEEPNGSTISVSLENSFMDFSRSSGIRLNDAQQRVVSSSDKSLSHLASLQQRVTLWGRVLGEELT